MTYSQKEIEEAGDKFYLLLPHEEECEAWKFMPYTIRADWMQELLSGQCTVRELRSRLKQKRK